MSKEEFLVFLHQLCHHAHSKEVLAAPLLNTLNIHIQSFNKENILKQIDTKKQSQWIKPHFKQWLLKIDRNKYRLKNEDVGADSACYI